MHPRTERWKEALAPTLNTLPPNKRIEKERWHQHSDVRPSRTNEQERRHQRSKSPPNKNKWKGALISLPTFTRAMLNHTQSTQKSRLNFPALFIIKVTTMNYPAQGPKQKQLNKGNQIHLAFKFERRRPTIRISFVSGDKKVWKQNLGTCVAQFKHPSNFEK